MKPLKRLLGSGRIRSRTPPARLTPISLIAAGLMWAQTAPSATNVISSLADSGPGSLRQALATANGGDAILIPLAGAISLTGGELLVAKDFSLVGPGAGLLTISGAGQSRVFKIETNVSVTISGLTIAGGRTAPGQSGGGIFNSGNLTLVRCILSGNMTGTGANGDNYKIYGGGGGSGGNGGGLFSAHVLALVECTVSNNSCGGGGTGGFGQVGGGSGGSGGAGGGIYSSGEKLTLSGCTILNNRAGSGGTGGSSSASPASGGWGGSGGGIYAEWWLAATNCTFVANAAGFGGAGGQRTSFPLGSAPPGLGGSGGGIAAGTNTHIIACTVAGNSADSTAPGSGTQAGGILGWGDGTSGGLLNTIVAQNTGLTPDAAGGFRSLGHNLIGITNGSNGFVSSGDLAGSSSSPLDPQLSPIALNGGSTLTMALRPGSPAIETGTTAGGPATDQRGVARPQGHVADIGAFEFEFTPRILAMKFASRPAFWLQVCGSPNATYLLQVSTNLANWVDLTNLGTDAKGLCEVIDPQAGLCPIQFYRMKATEP